MFDINELLSKRNQRDALKYFDKKHRTRGSTSATSDFECYWTINGSKIVDSIKNEKYEFGLINTKEILNKNGKKREISIYNSVDKFILRMLYQKLYRYFTPLFFSNSYAYQENKGVNEAIKKCKDYIDDGCNYVVEIDLKSYFDTIPLDRLESMIFEYIIDKKVRKLIHNALFCKLSSDGYIENKTIGIIQGSPISSVLANIYLTPLDNYMESNNLNWVRFADDINIYVKGIDETKTIYDNIISEIEKLGLIVNKQKSRVNEVGGSRYLGYDFIKKNSNIEVKKHVYTKSKTYNTWHTSCIHKIDHEYHILSNGVLNKKDYSILFENSEKKVYIPVEITDQINVYSNVNVSTDALNVLNEKNIRIVYISRFGEITGYYLPSQHFRSASTALKQMSFYNDNQKRLSLAKEMEIAMLHNIRSNLRYYKNRKQGSFDEAISSLDRFIEDIKSSCSVNELMLIEARARQIYYQEFNKIINDISFFFSTRSKRPPKDNINALISFGNTLLYNEFTKIISTTCLDIRIGIIHATNKRAFTLNLDFSDLFKPIITDRIIFTIINKKQIIESDFEAAENGGVYLSSEGKTIFINEFYKKLSSKIESKGRRITYRQLMINEINNYSNYINNNKKYKPYKYY